MFMYILTILYSSYESELFSTRLRLYFLFKYLQNIFDGVTVSVKPTPTLSLRENWTDSSSSNMQNISGEI